jgi:hypothetical protein
MLERKVLISSITIITLNSNNSNKYLNSNFLLKMMSGYIAKLFMKKVG